MDGFDHYGASNLNGTGAVALNFQNNGYVVPTATVVASTSYGKSTGSLGARLSSAVAASNPVWISKPIMPEQYKEQTPYAAQDFVILGFSFRMNQASTAELTIGRVGRHEISVLSDWSICGDGVPTEYKIEIGIWNFCELEVNKLANRFRIWMNDRLVYDAELSESEVILDTWELSALYKLNGANGHGIIDVDDMYLMDGSGTVNKNRLGKVSVTTRYPAADVQVQMSRSSGSNNWSRVSEASPDSDSSYVFSAVPGTTDFYQNTAALAAIDENAVVAIAVVPAARMTEPDSLSVAAVVRSKAPVSAENPTPVPVEQEGGRMDLRAAKYISEKAIFEIDPATGFRWKVDAVRLLEWGQRILPRKLD